MPPDCSEDRVGGRYSEVEAKAKGYVLALGSVDARPCYLPYLWCWLGDRSSAGVGGRGWASWQGEREHETAEYRRTVTGWYLFLYGGFQRVPDQSGRVPEEVRVGAD